jgi:geranylgeranyl diphosphate synthase, type II
VAAVDTKFDLQDYLTTKKSIVEVALDDSLSVTEPNVKTIIESMKYSLMAGGKRIRPILCLAACEMFEGNTDAAMPTAVALEMIHTMSLIHDDLPSMDNDDLRRGKPTNHVLYGEDVAILAGDALLSESFQHVARHTRGIPAERTVEVLRRLGTSVGAYGLAGGQVMDLQCENKAGTTIEDLEWIHMHKTAALLKVAVASGAIIGGASKEDVKACEVYAEKIGLVFQIADDILDVTATSEELGKTAGKDEDTNKTTYVKLMGLEGAKNEALKVAEEAKASLSKYGEKAAPLLGIADYIIGRKN